MGKLKLAGAMLLTALVAGLGAAFAASNGGEAARRPARAAVVPPGNAQQVVGRVTIDGIAGEGAGGSIDIRSFSWGVSQGGGSKAGGGAAGKATFDVFTVVKGLDIASPRLVVASASGEHVRSVRIEIAGGKQTITLTDVLISSVKASQNGAQGDIPLEEVSFNYAKLELEHKSGKSSSPVKGGWDLKTNRAV